MHEIYYYLTLSGVLTLVLWTPYIVARLFLWGPIAFLKNYTESFPIESPQQPLWAERAQRAHLNMVETMPAFIAVALGSSYMTSASESNLVSIAFWCAVFFWSRVVHALVYTLGVPFLRTPVYLVSWFAILAMAAKALM